MKKFKVICALIIFFLFIITILNMLKTAEPERKTAEPETKTETNDKIVFKDKNLESALRKVYKWEGTLTAEKASELSMQNGIINIDTANISDLEGLQYFKYIYMLNLADNNLSDLSLLPNLKDLFYIDFGFNVVKGKELETVLMKAGKIHSLGSVIACDDNLESIEFLSRIGNIGKYNWLNLSYNKITDISILKDATNLEELHLSDNRITDVTPLKDLDNLTTIEISDNCIIDYSPIKPAMDAIYNSGYDGVRYDFYENPVNFKYNGMTIKFKYLTVYYKEQAYAEAIPLLKALGGSATYDKDTGTLTCKYEDEVLIFRDFSEKYTFKGKEKSLEYPMRRMQYDLAYVPVKDICKVLGFKYSVVETRVMYMYEGNDFPKLVEISKK